MIVLFANVSLLIFIIFVPVLKINQLICRESCNFRAYQHPTTEDRVEPYWCYQKPIVSSCPSYFMNWKLSRDCKEAVSSWIYYNNTIYRNSYCAICHLGDDIIQSSTEGISPVFHLARELVSNHINIKTSVPTSSHIGLVKLDVNSNTCSYNDLNASTSYKTWDSIGVDQHCFKLPFNTNCNNKNSWSETFPFSNLSTESLCSGLPNPYSERIKQPSVPLSYLPQLRYTPPSYAAFFFSDIADLPLNIVLNSSWETINGSANVCTNSSLIDLSTGVRYSRFKLTASGVRVSLYKMDLCVRR